MTPITSLKGIGDKNAALYGKIGINTVEDAVFYFPRDYVTYEDVKCGKDLECDIMLAFCGVVVKRPLVKKVGRLSITTADLSADGMYISAKWFNMPYLNKSLKPGSSFVFRGKLAPEGDHLHIDQPQIFTTDQYNELLGRINPVYPLTKGLTNNAITKTVKRSFEYLGGNFRKEVYDMHFPKDAETLVAARKALVYEELLLFILRLRLLKEEGDSSHNDFNIIDTAICQRVIERLPYQLRVWSEIREDLCSDHSMRRLIQGDVGCGKTILATLAAIMVGASGYQSAIMAPTEILANQHYESIKALLNNSGIELKPVLLTGSMSASAKKSVRNMIENKEADIIIGTHALFQEKVVYNDLALVVTDEQHRFGVSQRFMLSSKNKKNDAHVLVMSATPIPRTLAIIMYGDLDISVIDEVPSHKKPVKNALVGESYRKKTYEFMKKEIDAHHQVYVICPLIEESEGLDAKNVTDTAAVLSDVFGDSVKIGVLHGKMKGSDKQKVMEDFAGGYIDILVSTTVVEVGVNVPNATVMLIENAERFGLAALHQLRGRIGRGSSQSYCIFMCGSDKEETLKRLDILKETNDGFKIAEEDLKMRGPGDMFGFRQSGDIRFKLADIYTDANVLKKAADDATAILTDDPALEKSKNAHLKKALEEMCDATEIGASL